MWTIYFVGMLIYLFVIPKRVHNYTHYQGDKGFVTILWTFAAIVWPFALGLSITVATIISLITFTAYIFVPAFRKDIVSFYINVIEEIKSFSIIKESE